MKLVETKYHIEDHIKVNLETSRTIFNNMEMKTYESMAGGNYSA